MLDDFKAPKSASKKKFEQKAEPSIRMRREEPDDTIVIDDGMPVEETAIEPQDKAERSNDTSRRQRLVAWWKSLNRNVRFGIIAASLVVFCAVVLAIYFFTQPKSNPSLEIIKHPKPAPKITTVASPLTGVQVDPSLAARPVTGIMIENSDWARPQSGLQDAGVVYEAIAEAGITRFLALYQESTPQYIGPVRSLRPYFIDYAAPFQASIVHVGGSPDALHEVENGNFRNLDQFFNSGAFWRISSRDAPHNVYTSFSKLDALEKSKGFTKSSFVSWPRKSPAPLKTPTASAIDFKISSPDYYVHYDYDAKANAYLRSEGGGRHYELTSSGTKVSIDPTVVIAMVVPLSDGALDSSGAYYSDYNTNGSGVAYVFQDGNISLGTWTKDGTDGQVQFTDKDGHPLKLDAGQTWITLVSSTDQVSYK